MNIVDKIYKENIKKIRNSVYRKNDLAEVFKNLTRFRFKNNFVGLSK